MGLEGRYTVVKKVADGGMAEIFLARQTGAQGFARLVILKRILPVFSVDPHFRNMLIDEAHIAMSLHHSNIVQVLDLGEAEGRYFLALELVDGWDLATVVARGEAARLPFPTGLALYVVAEVCRALAYAHGQTRQGKPLGIVHRDISPQNVLISEEGEVKLTDFGIAKAMGKRERTQTGVIKGKLEFMSPEQATGAALGHQSDIFSLGALLYVLATGKRPFEADGQLETLVRVQNAQFVAAEVVCPDLSPRIAAIVKRAMMKAPADRYPSAGEMLRDVEEVLRGEFQSVGQSELKSYLETLGRKDKVPSIARAPGLPQGDDPTTDRETPAESGRTLALGQVPRRSPSSPTLALAATQQGEGARAEDTPQGDASGDAPVPVDGPRRLGRLVLSLAVLLVMIGVAGTLYFLSPPQLRRSLMNGGHDEPVRARSAPPTPPAARVVPPPPVVAAAPVGSAQTSDGPPAPKVTEPPASPRPTPAVAAAAAPARVERPALVTLWLTSRPAGAVVRNKTGAVVGTTPLSLSLKPGSAQRLTFSKKGYASVTRRLPVADSDDTVSVELVRATGHRPHRR